MARARAFQFSAFPATDNPSAMGKHMGRAELDKIHGWKGAGYTPSEVYEKLAQLRRRARKAAQI